MIGFNRHGVETVDMIAEIKDKSFMTRKEGAVDFYSSETSRTSLRPRIVYVAQKHDQDRAVPEGRSAFHKPE